MLFLILRIRNPGFPNAEHLWRFKNFAGVTEEKKRKHETEAEFRGEADVDEEDFHDRMNLFSA